MWVGGVGGDGRSAVVAIYLSVFHSSPLNLLLVLALSLYIYMSCL